MWALENVDKMANSDFPGGPAFETAHFQYRGCAFDPRSATLRENDLEVVADILPISARLIANKASFKFKNRQLEEMLARMKEQVK